MKYRGVIYIPYQVSMMAMCEHYQLGIPMFVPTLELLVKWQAEFHVIKDKTSPNTHHFIRHRDRNPLPTSIPGVARHFDPNSDTDLTSLKYWLRYADFYQWPNVIQYDSFENLASLLQSTNLRYVSNEMKGYRSTLRHELQDKWTKELLKLEEDSKWQ